MDCFFFHWHASELPPGTIMQDVCVAVLCTLLFKFIIQAAGSLSTKRDDVNS